jgi:hypothetical protein
MSSGCEPQSPGAPPFSRWSRSAAGEVTASSVVGAASGCPVVAQADGGWSCAGTAGRGERNGSGTTREDWRRRSCPEHSSSGGCLAMRGAQPAKRTGGGPSRAGEVEVGSHASVLQTTRATMQAQKKHGCNFKGITSWEHILCKPHPLCNLCKLLYGSLDLHPTPTDIGGLISNLTPPLIMFLLRWTLTARALGRRRRAQEATVRIAIAIPSPCRGVGPCPRDGAHGTTPAHGTVIAQQDRPSPCRRTSLDLAALPPWTSPPSLHPWTLHAQD